MYLTIDMKLAQTQMRRKIIAGSSEKIKNIRSSLSHKLGCECSKGRVRLPPE